MKKIYFLLINFLLLSVLVDAQVVINEVYGGGGNSGATYKNDFIELYNNGEVAVNLTGWSVQYASSTGSSWQITSLSGSIPAHGYYLIQEAAGSGGTVSLPTPDVKANIAMGAASGKVALVNNQTALSGTCSTSTAIIDFVGFGSANCYEGSGPTVVLTNATSAQRKTIGLDSNDNKNDFASGSPSPTNSGIDTEAPVASSLSPANGATNVAFPVTAQINFNENIAKGTGSISLKKLTDGSLISSLSVADASVIVSGTSVSFSLENLNFSTGYYIEVSSGAFTDITGNAFAGFTSSTTWNFTTLAPIAGIVDKTYSFDVCSSSLAEGFSQYSVTGAQKWVCTTFGKDAIGSSSVNVPYAPQMNGYASGSNNKNEDWLISPSFDLTSTSYPLISFWSRTAYTGASLQLKVSTDYSGTGNPNQATWTDLDGKFPAEVSDTWTLSENINLSNFKQSKVYFAFVYTSTTEDGARWTVDDILLKNSLTPPPPSIYANVSTIDFPFVANGQTEVKSFAVKAFDLTGPVDLSISGNFQLSKDGNSFSTSVQLSKDEANNKETTLYLKFSPAEANKSYHSTITISSENASESVDVSGSSIDPATTLEVVNWNLEWFGSTSLGPTNDDLQEQNIKTVLNNLKADLYCVLEVVDENRLKNVVAQMPGYAYKISDFASHTNPFETSPGPLSEAQKLAFIYKTDIFTNVSTSALLSAGVNTAADLANTNYDYWSSGRFPFMLSADVTLNCRTEKMKFVLVHAKANTSPLNTSYERRKNGADQLHDFLNQTYPNDKIVILGDFNDDLDQSITTNYTTTSWSSFTSDADNFEPITLPLSLAGKKSTVSYNDVIDHVVISNEMEPLYLPNSVTIKSDVSALINKYGTTTTDHYPVFSRYQLPNTVAPQIANNTSEISFCKESSSSYTIPELTATDDCGDKVNISYTITGATNRSGDTGNASGNFGLGESVINWSVTDSWGNLATSTTIVRVNNLPEVSIPDAFAAPKGVDVNSVYLGYTAAESISLEAHVDNISLYTFEWSDGSGIIATTPSITVSPKVATTYTVKVTNSSECLGYASKLINVIDVRGGKNLDKVTICHTVSNKTNTLVINAIDVQDHLAHGDYLGSCGSKNLKKSAIIPETAEGIDMDVYPNPTANYFNVALMSGNNEPIDVRIFNILGTEVERFNKQSSGTVLHLGNAYTPGVYFIESTQGDLRLVKKLVKK
jgi:Predicted extracellular nuclease